MDSGADESAPRLLGGEGDRDQISSSGEVDYQVVWCWFGGCGFDTCVFLLGLLSSRFM